MRDVDETLGTSLDAEEPCYPSGALRDSRRRARVLCSDGRVRTATVGIPDTFFSIPARVKIKGKTVTGYVTAVDAVDIAPDRFPPGRGPVYVFLPFTYGKNGAVLPELPYCEWLRQLENPRYQVEGHRGTFGARTWIIRDRETGETTGTYYPFIDDAIEDRDALELEGNGGAA